MALFSTVSNTSWRLIFATGNGEQVDLLGASIISGTLETTDGALILTSDSNSITDVTIDAGSVVEALAGTLSASNVKVDGTSGTRGL